VSRAFTPTVEGQWFEPWSSQVKDWKTSTCTCCLPG